MSDSQDKSEQATPFKQAEARKKGQVAKSQELLTFAMLLVFVLSFAMLAQPLASALLHESRYWLLHADVLAASLGQLPTAIGLSLQPIVHLLLPLAVALMLVGILVNLLFSGPTLSFTPLSPDGKRLSPLAGFKRIFSRRLLVDLLKTLIKGALFALVLYHLLFSLLPVLLSGAGLLPAMLPVSGKQLFMQLAFALLLVMAAAAVFDAWYARREHARQLRMSKQDVREEHHRREGNPEVRAQRRRAQSELVRKLQALGQVRHADVVVVNPTHYAIALQYRPGSMPAPKVLAKGRGVLARRIRQLAQQHAVPIWTGPALARQLFAQADLDAAIPEAAQEGVAQVYRWVISRPGNQVVSP